MALADSDRVTLNSAKRATAIFQNLIGFRPVSSDHQVDWTRFFDANSRPPAARAQED
jgi:hypothetical protein